MPEHCHHHLAASSLSLILQSQGQLCYGEALLCQQLCQLRTQEWGHFQIGCGDWNPLNFKNAQNSSDWSNCNKCTNHSLLHFKEFGHQRTLWHCLHSACAPAKLHRGTRAFNSFAETLSSLYKHNHLPADQTAAMTPTPVALSLVKTTHIVLVKFTELLSLRHCTKKVTIHLITQAFWFDPGVHFLN